MYVNTNFQPVCTKWLCNRHMGLAKVAVQWLIEHLCFVSSVVLVDSFVLRIRHLRQAQKRYKQP